MTDYERNQPDYETPDVDDVLASRPRGLLDPEVEPEPLLCRTCPPDRTHRWTWWGGRGPIRGRWCPPSIPCHACALTVQLAGERAELNRRQEQAGIAVTHRPYRWDLRTFQALDETWPDLCRRVRLSPGQIGVAREDISAARTVCQWRPGHGGVYLHGAPGSGKSMWLSALVTGLIAPTTGQRRELSVEEMVRLGVTEATARKAVEARTNVWVTPTGAQTVQAMVVDEEEIVRRVSLAWKGDQVPLLGIARAQVLVYDDVGTVLLGGGGKAAELARQCMDRLIDLRWREHRPLLATSNRSLDEVCEAVSDRTASRLRALIDHEYQLRGVPPHLLERGWSWRRPPPAEAA